ncbi:hypothetical protein V1520DRAFT_187524 [Lipomyces starkeyi]
MFPIYFAADFACVGFRGCCVFLLFPLHAQIFIFELPPFFKFPPTSINFICTLFFISINFSFILQILSLPYYQFLI